MSEAVAEALEWLDGNPEAEPEEYRDKLKEVEDICQPIVSKAYGAGGAPGGGGDAGGAGDEEDIGDHDEL